MRCLIVCPLLVNLSCGSRQSGVGGSGAEGGSRLNGVGGLATNDGGRGGQGVTSETGGGMGARGNAAAGISGASAAGAGPIAGSGGAAGAETAGSVSGAPGEAGHMTSAGGISNGGAGSPSAAGAAPAGASGAGTGGAANPSTCPASALTGGNLNRTVQVGGVSRTYILHVPTSYSGTQRVPLVFDFHALGGTGSQEQSSSGYQQIADKEGFLIAFPNGIDNAWNIGPCCTNSRDVDDLGFARAMVTAISSDGCVDSTRVYATGFSMGGGMSHYLACNAADVFAAAAPSSFDLLVPDEEPCMPSRPISVLAYRGTADTEVPYAGGPGPNGRITFLGAQGSFERWAEIDGCTDSPTASDSNGCSYYEQCDAGVEVGLCVKQGGGHAPGDPNVGWSFLSKFTLP